MKTNAEIEQFLMKALCGDEEAMTQADRAIGEGVLTSDQVNGLLKALDDFPDNPNVMTLCAGLYRVGLRTPIDRVKAIKLYERAIEAGSMTAIVERAFMYREGFEEPVDVRKAIEIHRVTIEGGRLASIAVRAYMKAMHAHDVDRSIQMESLVNFTRAIELYERLIEAGHLRGMVGRAIMHFSGFGGPIDHTKAIVLLEQAITLGDPAAMRERAWMHLKGRGGSVDYARAISFYENAIKLGDLAALMKRALMYYNGQGGPVDYCKAIELYECAIALDYASAMNHRARMHIEGKGGPVDYSKAIDLYERAIALGDAYAMSERALMHFSGQGGPMDDTKGIELLYLAYVEEKQSLIQLFPLSELKFLSRLPIGIEPSQPLRRFKLFMIYFMGIHTEPDEHKARDYFNKSKQQCMKLLNDEIKDRLRHSKRLESDRTEELIAFALHNMSGCSLETKCSIYYLRLKWLLLVGRKEEAYRLYNRSLPGNVALPGTVYYTLATYLIDKSKGSDDPKILVRYRAEVCRLLVWAYDRGKHEGARDLLVRILRSPEESLIALLEKSSPTSLSFFKSNETDTLPLIEDYKLQARKLRGTLIAGQRERLITFRRSLDKEAEQKGFFQRLTTSVTGNKVAGCIDYLIAEMKETHLLSDVVKVMLLDGKVIPAQVRAYVGSVLEDSQDINPFAESSTSGAAAHAADLPLR